MKAGEHDRLPEGDNAGAERWLEFGYLLPYCSFDLRFGDCSLWSDGLQAVRVWIPTESVRRCMAAGSEVAVLWSRYERPGDNNDQDNITDSGWWCAETRAKQSL